MAGINCIHRFAQDYSPCFNLLSNKFGNFLPLTLLTLIITSFVAIVIANSLGKRTKQMFKLAPGTIIGYGTILMFASFIAFVFLIVLAS